MAKNMFPQALTDFGKSNNADTVTYFEGPSLTRAEFQEECDINSLMAKYDAHVIGGPGNLGPTQGMYYDFTAMPRDLLEYQELMLSATSAFMSLPAVVRKEFENDPRLFVEFASDRENLEQMRTWGLAPPLPQPSEPPPGASSAPGGGDTPSGK